MPSARSLRSERESPAKGGKVVELRPPPWDWSFEVGRLPRPPASGPTRKCSTRFRAPLACRGWPSPRPQGSPPRRQRQAMRARVRRAAAHCRIGRRRPASHSSCSCSRHSAPADRRGHPEHRSGTAARLLPAGPPRAQIVAMQDTLRIQLPINQSRVTAIGYHASGSTRSRSTRRDAGKRGPLRPRRQPLFGQRAPASATTRSAAVSVRRPAGSTSAPPTETDVYAPVDGTVIAISTRS